MPLTPFVRNTMGGPANCYRSIAWTSMNQIFAHAQVGLVDYGVEDTWHRGVRRRWRERPARAAWVDTSLPCAPLDLPLSTLYWGSVSTLRPLVAVLTIAAASASGCAMSVPTLLPAAPARADQGDPLWKCLREAQSGLQVNPGPLDAAAKGPLGGRNTFGFLSWASLSGPRPVVSWEGYPSAQGSSLLTVRTKARRELADRYVLCLLALGFHWLDQEP
jgi:hypothetical protein